MTGAAHVTYIRSYGAYLKSPVDPSPTSTITFFIFTFFVAYIFDFNIAGRTVDVYVENVQEYTDLAPTEIEEVVSLKLALVGLAGFENFYPAEISGGMRKRAGLARAMALDPEILFFDEPSAGLDPIAASSLREDLASLASSEGVTIFLTTHNLDEAEKLCDLVGVIRDGEVITVGHPDELR